MNTIDYKEQSEENNFGLPNKRRVVIKRVVDDFKPQVGDLSDCIDYIESKKSFETENTIIFLPKALREIDKHIGWGQHTSENILEQGGIMVGMVFKSGKALISVITDIVPLSEGRSTSISFETDLDIFSRALSKINTIQGEARVNKYSIGTYHTHPCGLSVFMSGIDQRNQIRLFPREWQFSVVINPQKRICCAYNGIGITEARCIFAVDRDRDKDLLKTFAGFPGLCAGWKKLQCLEMIQGELEIKANEDNICNLISTEAENGCTVEDCCTTIINYIEGLLVLDRMRRDKAILFHTLVSFSREEEKTIPILEIVDLIGFIEKRSKCIFNNELEKNGKDNISIGVFLLFRCDVDKVLSEIQCDYDYYLIIKAQENNIHNYQFLDKNMNVLERSLELYACSGEENIAAEREFYSNKKSDCSRESQQCHN